MAYAETFLSEEKVSKYPADRVESLKNVFRCVLIGLFLSRMVLQTYGNFHKTTCNKFKMVYCIYWGATGFNFQNILYFFLWRSDFILANSADSDEMWHYAAFHLGLHCLAKWDCSGSFVECLTRDRGAEGLSLTGVTALCPRARTVILA